MSGPAWSASPPTAPGYYWFTPTGHLRDAAVAHVYATDRDAPHQLRARLAGADFTVAAWPALWWPTPVAPPPCADVPGALAALARVQHPGEPFVTLARVAPEHPDWTITSRAVTLDAARAQLALACDAFARHGRTGEIALYDAAGHRLARCTFPTPRALPPPDPGPNGEP